MEELSQVVPYYDERLLLQPGLTGWAQVRYAYGSTVDDSDVVLSTTSTTSQAHEPLPGCRPSWTPSATVLRGVSYSCGYDALKSASKQPVAADIRLSFEVNAR